jgi:hypothetical protein
MAGMGMEWDGLTIQLATGPNAQQHASTATIRTFTSKLHPSSTKSISKSLITSSRSSSRDCIALSSIGGVDANSTYHLDGPKTFWIHKR